MLTAITRAVSPAIVHCELSFIDRKPINLATAQEQHHAYEKLLGKLGARVISLPAEPELPDSMFVEDPAIVLDELAVILPLGTDTRRREAPSLAQALGRFRKLTYVSLPGTLEGGDVLRIDRRIFVGLTKRSNADGIRSPVRGTQLRGGRLAEGLGDKKPRDAARTSQPEVMGNLRSRCRRSHRCGRLRTRRCPATA